MKKRLIIMISLIALVFLIGCGSNTDTPTGNVVAKISESDDSISIPISAISTTLKKLTYNADGTVVTYFAVLGTDGEVRVAFDACDVCGGSKGYRQEGTDIVCNNCGKVFRIDGLGTQNKGYGCWPSYLPHQIEGDNVIIKKADIKSGAFRFA
ncbi:DUF2318 domain-containing protein [Candidatus Woesearchaeota archaeon]|nr:DUF2318 domain-containing protein [Candidatus Woesearchaeota archaeon]